MDGAEAVDEFERDCLDAPAVQEKVLAHILEVNRGVEYLAKYGAVDVESFRKQVPSVRYEDIAVFVERMADGDSAPILTNDAVISFSLSSGTSGGKPKMVPETQRAAEAKRKVYSISGGYRNRFFPGQSTGLGLAFNYAGKQFETKSGLKIGAGSTNYFRSPAFKYKPFKYSSPDEVVLGHNWRESTYCHLLCGLLQREQVDHIIAIFAFNIVEAVRMLEAEWRNLCQDIRTGTLNETVVKNADIRDAVLKVMRPDTELADVVAEICGRTSWSGIIHQLWPKARFVMTVVTGSMKPYVPALRQYNGTLPIVGLDYIASEGIIGINIEPLSDPDKITFTVVPGCNYLEFIPLVKKDQADDDEDCIEGDLVGIDGVQVGKEYEVVVTNAAGLYRFRIGDVVKVTGFFHKSPRLLFSRRRSAVLSINTDKTDEEELQKVVDRASREHGVDLSDFTSYADLSTKPGHYVIFWELRRCEDYGREDVLRECCATMDRLFNNPYMRGRAAETIGPLELVVVKQGTFARLCEASACPGQYKTPRCIKNGELLALLRQASAGSYSSPQFPRSLLESWKPLTGVRPV